MKKLFFLFSALAFSLVANAANFPDVYVTGTSKFDGKITNIFLTPSRVLVTGTDKSLASVGTTGLITGAGTAAGASDVTTALGYTPLTNTAAAITNALGYAPVNKAGDTNATALFEFGSLQLNTQLTLSNDVKLVRDAANTLALRNGANAQTFNLYNTYTDASNYERGAIYWSGNTLYIKGQNAGTGSARNMQIISGNDLYLGAAGSAKWYLDGPTGGHLKTAADNTYDIGASGANRPRSAYIAKSVQVPEIQSGYTKVCTSASSNALFYVSVPNTNMIGGRVLYTVSSTDGTDAQQITGTAQFGAVGKGTAVTANVTDVQNTSTVSAGTLTASLTANVSTNNTFALMVTPTTSLTTTNLVVKWRLETPSTYTVNPL